jgi:hypothetical protein
MLSVLGLALEIWDSWEQAKRDQAFREVIAKMVDNFEKQRAELLGLIDGPLFENQFFPELLELRGNVDAVAQSVAAGRQKSEQFHRWRDRGEAIDTEFRMMDAS